jgi:Zn-dependent peptidase ImmA (M78 family)
LINLINLPILGSGMLTDFQKIREEAQKIIKDNYVTVPPVRIDEIAKNYGLIVLEADLDDSHNVSGFIDIKNKRIILNRRELETRRAFIIAQQLGLYLLHKDKLDQNPDVYAIIHRKPIGAETNVVEKEVVCFATHLLIPDELLQKYKDYDNNTIAKIFGVPLEVVGLRKSGGLYGTA